MIPISIRTAVGIKGKFTVNGVIINFVPLIEAHHITGNFVLSHWNKVAGLPAFYDGSSNQYYLRECEQIMISTFIDHRYIDIKQKVLPSCVLFYPNAQIQRLNEDRILIQKN